MPAQRIDISAVVITALLVVLVAAAPATGQEATPPSGTLTGAEITVDAGDVTNVTAEYRFTFSSIGNGSEELSAISGTLWTFPEHVPQNFSATVNGEPVELNVTQHGRYLTLSVPVDDVSTGETVRVGLSYTVPEPGGELKAPLWVPNYQTGGTDRVLDLRVILPQGEQPNGATFPRVDTASNGGNVLEYRLLHMPGFVNVEYVGEEGLVSLDTALTVFGLLFLVSFFGAWIYYTRGLQRGGDESGA